MLNTLDLFQNHVKFCACLLRWHFKCKLVSDQFGMLDVCSISQDLQMPATWRFTKFQTNVLARSSAALCHFHGMLWVIMCVLFSFCLFYQLLRRAQMVWLCQTTTVIFVWEIPTWTRKPAHQKCLCPAQTVGVLVKQPHISPACLLWIFLDQMIIGRFSVLRSPLVSAVHCCDDGCCENLSLAVHWMQVL